MRTKLMMQRSSSTLLKNDCVKQGISGAPCHQRPCRGAEKIGNGRDSGALGDDVLG